MAKFKIGDKIRFKDVDGVWGVMTIASIYKECYMFEESNTPLTISYVDENFELVEEPKPKLKLGVDLNDELRIDTLWKDTLANLVGDITKRNTDSFVWLIDETLKFMDCGAYNEMACRGMRLFAKELKKRLGHEDHSND